MSADIVPMAPFVKREGGKYPGQLRLPKGDAIPTCDWGECDRPTVLERFLPQLGWLAVCDECALKPLESGGQS